jgi:hypothetical protein
MMASQAYPNYVGDVACHSHLVLHYGHGFVQKG